MMRYRFITGLVIGVLLGVIPTYAGIIKSPPVLKELPVELHDYLSRLFNNINSPEVQTTTPNGSRKGKIGNLIIFNDSGTFKLFTNTDGDNTWQQL